MQDGDVVETLHRQNQVRQLEDTWPMDGLCIYKYQLATQIEQRDRWNHPSQHTHFTHTSSSHTKSLTLLQVSFSSYSSECHMVMSGSELVGCHSDLFVQH